MSKKRKKRKKKTIGKMTNSRGTWQMNPVTRVKDDEKNTYNRNKEKRKLKRGDY